MSDLRTRIAAALRTADRRVAGFIGYDEMADAVIAELDLGIPCAATGCRMRQIARKASSKEDPW